MFSLNRVHIIGYQTQPVPLRQTPGGTSVTDLNVIVPYSFQAEGGAQVDAKGFHTVTLWGPMAEVASKYVRPGGQIFIAGRLQTDSWEDEKSGEKKSRTKLVALDLILLDPKDGQLPAPKNAHHVSGCLNRADIIGHVTRDPEMRTTTSGQKVLTLGVATNERWKDKATGEDKERAEYHNVVIWGPLAEEVSLHIKKGNRVYATGRVQTRSWEAKDGSKRYTTEVIADSVLLLGAKNPVAEGSVQNDASPRRMESSPPTETHEPQVAVPEIAYASEIKAEDLPF